VYVTHASLADPYQAPGCLCLSSSPAVRPSAPDCLGGLAEAPVELRWTRWNVMPGAFCCLPSKLLWDVTLTWHLGIDAATFVPSLKLLPKKSSGFSRPLFEYSCASLYSFILFSLADFGSCTTLPRLVRHSTRPRGEPHQPLELLNILIAHTSISTYTRVVPDLISCIHNASRTPDYRRFLLDKSRVPATSCARTGLWSPA
jgi:hypothetical protein